MRNFFIGLAIGLVLCGVVSYILIAGIKQTSYNTGYDAGSRKGMATGTAMGIAQGVAQVQAQQKEERDSIAAVDKKRAAMQRAAAMRKPKKVVKEVQNWHVIDGKIADPVTE